MTKRLFLIFLILISIVACGKKKNIHRPSQPSPIQTELADQSDRESNGGLLRFKLEGKAMYDKFFVAQFTPRGDLFAMDNLQLYNYNLGSDKFPQFIINLDYKESDLSKWEGKVFPMDFLAFTIAPNTLPLNSKGTIEITDVTQTAIEGRFSGELVNPRSHKSFAINGEFKATIKVNI
jgi:hypothetical protein